VNGATRRRTGFLALAALLLAGLLGACGSGGTLGSSSATFKNPVYKTDFPDPFVLHAGKYYYGYATNGHQRNIQEIRSTDLVHWKDTGDALPVTPRWVDANVWAPEVARLKDGTYAMYYAGHDQALDVECLGMARSKTAAGPFIDRSAKPFLCQSKQGGTIDADVFRDSDGQLYLYYKNDGNCCGDPVYLWGQRLSEDGSRLLGKPSTMTDVEQSWEGNLVEAPTMWKHDGKYFLFFSGGAFDSLSYASGYATCRGPLGPCKQYSGNPILHTHTGCNGYGPGHQAIIADASGQDWLVYHAWLGPTVGYDSGGARELWIDRLNWKGDKPVTDAPDCKRQPAPSV
jgi:beta-xylosidase